MSAFSEVIDRFVRWFFNSSPTVTEIESLDREPGRVPALVEKGVLCGAAVIALILILVFHSVVAGAVDRAAKRHVAPQVDAALSSQRTPHRPVAIANGDAFRAPSFAPRSVSYVRRTN